MVPKPTRKRAIEEIAMDFSGELLQSDGFNVIIVVTDCFTKVQYYILAETTCRAENVADSYIGNIWKLYGLLRHETSDWDPSICLQVLQRAEPKAQH